MEIDTSEVGHPERRRRASQHWFSSDTFLFSPFYGPVPGVISTAHPGEDLTVSNFGPANQIMVTSRLEGGF